MKFFTSVFVSALMSITAIAADVDGTWTGSAATPQGEIPVTFTFKADGAKLTGTTAAPDGATVSLKDGKIEDKTITFAVTFDFGGTPIAVAYKGVVDPDQIKMTANAAGVPLDILLKKSKAVAVDGTWAGAVGGPQGEIPVSFTFKADGAKLTGSTTGLDGAPLTIADGKIDGSNIAFTVSMNLGGTPIPMSYKGSVSPDQIKMSGEAFGMPFEFVLKKAKQ